MHTLETEAEVRADGSVKLLSPLPSWLKPGRAHVFLIVEESNGTAPKAPLRRPVGTPEMVARRMKALADIQRMNPYRDIDDPVAWQRETRLDRPLSGRE